MSEDFVYILIIQENYANEDCGCDMENYYEPQIFKNIIDSLSYLKEKILNTLDHCSFFDFSEKKINKFKKDIDNCKTLEILEDIKDEFISNENLYFSWELYKKDLNDLKIN